jgi:hypothetical protein
MGFKGEYDKEAGTIDISGAGMSLDTLDGALKWMEGVRREMAHRQMVDDGGIRWEFRHGDAPTAQLMRGKKSWMRPFKLVPIRPRRANKCAACKATIDAGTSCWRQAPGAWSGHSHDRFCERCVSRGAAPCPPKLRLVVS